jgi:hypothetical protein
MIEIDKGIPMPPGNNPGRGRKRIYPWQGMEVGDSFFVAGKKHTNITGALSYRTKRFGYRYACRLGIEGGIAGIRVWRTE